MNDNIIQLDFTIINCHCEAQPVPSELRESNPGLVVIKHYFERSGIGKRDNNLRHPDRNGGISLIG